MSHISNEKWSELKKRMQMLGINEGDIQESFILGSGSGGQKLNKTHCVVQLIYKTHQIRKKVLLKSHPPRSCARSTFRSALRCFSTPALASADDPGSTG